MTPTQARPGHENERRRVFDAARRDADAMLARDGDPSPFAVWALATVRRQPTPELRHAALDGVMAALDDDEARRTP